nr:immunoglobulin light chain junction region [Macaca mulatta]
CLQTKDSPRTF